MPVCGLSELAGRQVNFPAPECFGAIVSRLHDLRLWPLGLPAVACGESPCALEVFPVAPARRKGFFASTLC